MCNVLVNAGAPEKVAAVLCVPSHLCYPCLGGVSEVIMYAQGNCPTRVVEHDAVVAAQVASVVILVGHILLNEIIASLCFWQM